MSCDSFEQACGRPVPYLLAPRRAGDVAQCYADSSLAERHLGWRAQLALADMCTLGVGSVQTLMGVCRLEMCAGRLPDSLLCVCRK